MMKNWSFPLSKTLAGNRNWRVPCERPFRSIRPLLLFWSVDTEFTSGGVTGSRPRPCQQCLLYPELTWSLSGDWYGSAWFPLLFSKWKPRKSREHNQLMNNTRQQKWLRSDRASNIISIKVFFVFVFFGWQVRVFGLLAGTSSPYETTQHQLDSVIDRPLNGGGLDDEYVTTGGNRLAATLGLVSFSCPLSAPPYSKPKDQEMPWTSRRMTGCHATSQRIQSSSWP